MVLGSNDTSESIQRDKRFDFWWIIGWARVSSASQEETSSSSSETSLEMAIKMFFSLQLCPKKKNHHIYGKDP